jgi:hypothetical protein
MNKMPKVKVVIFENAQGARRAEVSGFDDLDIWATRNDTAWRRIKQNCLLAGASEIDTLKVLSAFLLDENQALKDGLVEELRSGRYIPTFRQS